MNFWDIKIGGSRAVVVFALVVQERVVELVVVVAVALAEALALAVAVAAAVAAPA